MWHSEEIFLHSSFDHADQAVNTSRKALHGKGTTGQVGPSKAKEAASLIPSNFNQQLVAKMHSSIHHLVELHQALLLIICYGLFGFF